MTLTMSAAHHSASTPTKPSLHRLPHTSSSKPSISPAALASANLSVPQAPVYRPTIEEFKNPYKYIHSIRHHAMQYGICKIIPPPEWQFEKSFDWTTKTFTTKLQHINELQTRAPADAVYSEQPTSPGGGDCDSDTSAVHIASVSSESDDGNLFDDTMASSVVIERTISDVTTLTTSTPTKAITTQSTSTSSNKRVRKTVERLAEDPKSATSTTTTSSKKKRVKRTKVVFNDHSTTVCSVCSGSAHDDRMLLCDSCDCGVHLFCLTRPLTEVPDGDWYCAECQAEREHWFGFGSGGEYTLQQFKRYADKYLRRCFQVDNTDDVPHQRIVNEYWRIVESADHARPVTVKYGSDVDTQTFGSGYPIDGAYASDGWNLNNLALLPESMLSFLDAGSISGVTVPWLYIGMLFSSFCWHNEDQYCHSINFIHTGASKQWYGVPSFSAAAFEQQMCDYNPQLFQSCPDLLFHLVTMLSPSRLQQRHADRQPVALYQCVQHAGEIVLTFPQAYHAGFNCGFNIAESVNFACNDWLPLGLKCLDRWRSFRRTQCFSHDRLICNIAQRYAAQQQRSSKMASSGPGIVMESNIANTRDQLTADAGNGYITLETAAWLLPVIRKLRDREKRGREILYKLGVTRGKYWKTDSDAPVTKRKVRMSMSAHVPVKDATAMSESNDSQPFCIICKHYLWISCVKCKCQPTKSSCLAHSSELCECAASQKLIYFRYDLAQLDRFISALEDGVYSVDSNENRYDYIMRDSQDILDTVDPYPSIVRVSDARLNLLDTDGAQPLTTPAGGVMSAKKTSKKGELNASDVLWNKADYQQYATRAQQWCTQLDSLLRDFKYSTIQSNTVVQFAALLERGEEFIWNDSRYGQCRVLYDKLNDVYTAIQQRTAECCKLHRLFQLNKEYAKELADKISKSSSSKYKTATHFTSELYYYYDIIPGKLDFRDAKQLLANVSVYSEFVCAKCNVNHAVELKNWCRFVDALEDDSVQFKSLEEIVVCIQTCIKVPIQINKISRLFKHLLQCLNRDKTDKYSTRSNDSSDEYNAWLNAIQSVDTSLHSILSIRNIGERAARLALFGHVPEDSTQLVAKQRENLDGLLTEHRKHLVCSNKVVGTVQAGYVLPDVDKVAGDHKCSTCGQLYMRDTKTYEGCCWQALAAYWNENKNITNYTIDVLRMKLEQYNNICCDILSVLPMRLQMLFVSKFHVKPTQRCVHINELSAMQSQLYKFKIRTTVNGSEFCTIVTDHIEIVHQWIRNKYKAVEDLYMAFDTLLSDRQNAQRHNKILTDVKLILLEASNLHIVCDTTILANELVAKLNQLKYTPVAISNTV